MHRQPFLTICADYRMHAARNEHALIDELTAHVAASPRCFERIRTDGALDIATCTLLLSPDIQSVLFLDHAKIGLWTQPGGHADGNPDIYAVAREEATEEVGITDITFVSEIPFHIHRFDYAAQTFGYPKSIYTLFFSATFSPDQTPRICEPDKCNGPKWFSQQDIANYITKTGDPYHINHVFLDKWARIIGT